MSYPAILFPGILFRAIFILSLRDEIICHILFFSRDDVPRLN